jgi:hypothetical protein
MRSDELGARITEFRAGQRQRMTRELLEKRPSIARGMFDEPVNTAAFRRCDCGAPARLVQAPCSGSWAVACECGARGESSHGPATAIQNWNRGRLGFVSRASRHTDARRAA